MTVSRAFWAAASTWVPTRFPTDCNENGVPDYADITSGASTDLNGNIVPDECEGLGDMDCNGDSNMFDIDPFVQALIDPAGYVADHDGDPYPFCDIMQADINGDGSVDGDDVDPFVVLLTSD